jgi:hypothetical protein
MKKPRSTNKVTPRLVVVMTAFLALMATAFIAPAFAAAGTVTIGSQSHQLDGVNVYRAANYLVQYTPAFGTSTQTNAYGFEAAVVGGKVTTVQNGVGNMAIPSNGYVLSGHGTSRTWLQANATVGATVNVTLGNGTGNGKDKLPDLGVRTLRQFTIANVNGVKELKFPTVTANVGVGPFEINGTRSSSTSTTWTVTQKIYNDANGSRVVTASGATFFWGGDGHNHWHIKDLDQFVLRDKGDTQNLRYGEKHGFCFEDNTEYRDWPQSRHNGAPANPVYVPPKACGVGATTATSVQEGLSVGWSDTYPSTLPDQYINITGIPDGEYKVRVTADWQNHFDESNENNNSSEATIQITGNTVTIISVKNGL